MGRRKKSRRRGRHPVFGDGDSLLDAHPVATLDLHGHTVSQARLAVVNFVETWRRREPGGLVHIVTGKGSGSSKGPVLRGAVSRLLTGTLVQAVEEFDLDLDEGGYLVRLSR